MPADPTREHHPKCSTRTRLLLSDPPQVPPCDCGAAKRPPEPSAVQEVGDGVVANGHLYTHPALRFDAEGNVGIGRAERRRPCAAKSDRDGGAMSETADHTDGYDCWCAPVFRDADGNTLTRAEAEQSWDAVTVIHQPLSRDHQPARLNGDGYGA